MRQVLDRREFLAASAGLGAALGLGLGAAPRPALAGEPAFKTTIHKALIRDHPTEDDLKRLKDAGFEGVEGGVLSPEEAGKCRQIAERLGMRVHSVLRRVTRLLYRRFLVEKLRPPPG